MTRANPPQGDSACWRAKVNFAGLAREMTMLFHWPLNAILLLSLLALADLGLAWIAVRLERRR